MISNQSNKDSNESQTMEALVPMVDLFAVLAIMFLIYSNNEIIETKQQNSELIKELVEKDETQARREDLAKKSGMSLQEIKKERKKKSKELMAQFSKMIAAQESQADEEYQVLIAKIEQDHEVQMQKEEAALEKEKSQQLEKEKQKMEVEKQKILKTEKRKNAAKMQAALSDAQAEQKAKVEATRQQVKKQAEQIKTAALAKQKEQIQQQVATQNSAAQAKAEAEKSQALADAAKQKASALAAAQSKSDAEKSQALADAAADAAKQKASALAAAQSESDAKKAQALADAAADAAKQKASELAQQKSAMDQNKKDALNNQKNLLGEAADHLAKLQKAADAKDKIVDQLNDNFKDFNSDAVEIDKKTGKVRLHFQESYFVRGAYTLSDDMKKFLRVIIPKYAKSIYGDPDAAKLVKSLKISGMTSPVYFGKYVDKNDITGRAEKARSFNMALSNKRAIALYNFIFDEVEMGDYQYRNRLKADMGIAALGYQKAKAVPAELVGKTADCKEYDCKKEQATILQFKLRVDDQLPAENNIRVDSK